MSRSIPVSEANLLREAFFELTESLDELSVAEEEIHLQSEQLRISRDVIEAERTRYRQLFDLAPDGYLVTDKLGVILEANAAALRMLNCSNRQIVGKPLTMFLVADERRNLRNVLSDLHRASYISDWETVIKPAGGAPTFYTSVTIGRDAAIWDETQFIRWIFRDITEQKRDQAKILALGEELERRVQERTHQLEAASHHERESASVFEQAMLHTPRIQCDTVCVETYYEAALGQSGVGGDFYDVVGFRRTEDDGSESDYLAIVVGDVSGKGLHAAGFAASVKFTLRGLIRRERTIEDIFDRLNEFVRTSKLYGDWSDGADDDSRHVEPFIVLAAVLVNQVSGVCELITAGAESVIAIRPDGTRTELVTKSMPLGIVDNYPYRRGEYRLESGEVLVLTTDGITGSRSEGRFFGTDGIANSLLSTQGSPLRQRAEHIVESARRHFHGAFSDDVCLVLAERK